MLNGFMNIPPQSVTLHADKHVGLISPVTSTALEDLAKEGDWRGFGMYMLKTNDIPSLDDYVGTWDVTRTGEIASQLFMSPKVLTLWTTWCTAHILNHFVVVAHSYARRNETWPKQYTVVRKCFLDIFATIWEPELTPEQRLSVQEFMLREGRSTLLTWIPYHMVALADHIDYIMEPWPELMSDTPKHAKKAMNKTRHRFGLIEKRQQAIRAIPEFGHFST